MKKNTFSWTEEEENWGGPVTICNVCGTRFMDEYDEADVGWVYCPRCGTRLTWEGKEEKDNE